MEIIFYNFRYLKLFTLIYKRREHCLFVCLFILFLRFEFNVESKFVLKKERRKKITNWIWKERVREKVRVRERDSIKKYNKFCLKGEIQKKDEREKNKNTKNDVGFKLEHTQGK